MTRRARPGSWAGGWRVTGQQRDQIIQHLVSGRWVACLGADINIDLSLHQQNTFQADSVSNVYGKEL